MDMIFKITGNDSKAYEQATDPDVSAPQIMSTSVLWSCVIVGFPVPILSDSKAHPAAYDGCLVWQKKTALGLSGFELWSCSQVVD